MMQFNRESYSFERTSLELLIKAKETQESDTEEKQERIYQPLYMCESGISRITGFT